MFEARMRNKNLFNYLFIAIAAALLFVPFIGWVPLFDWDEINFAESAREMLVTGDYLTVRINYEPFWEKPPLFIWFQVLSMKLFGINEFAARFPNAVCGIFTLCFLFWIGKKEVNQKFGFIWVVSYAGSLLPFIYFKSGIIDPWFNLFIFSSLYFAFQYLNRQHRPSLNVSAILIGLAILTKGPVGFMLFGLTLFIFLIFKKFRVSFTWGDVMLFLILVLLVGGFWFILQISFGNFGIIKEFVEYQIRLFQTQDAGHGGFFLYHWVVILVGVFPISFFALMGFGKNSIQKLNTDTLLWIKILLGVVLVVFTIVKTKIVHYSSLAYFPVSFIGTTVVYQFLHNEIKIPKWLQLSFIGTGGLIAAFVAGATFIEAYKTKMVDFLTDKDPFAAANLSAQVNWSGWEFLVALILLSGVLSSMFLIRQNYRWLSILTLFIGITLFSYSTLVVIVPKIEQYSQHAAIAFFKEKQGCDCYVTTLGYKSYAPYFYGQKMPAAHPESNDLEWLLKGPIDKPAYFIMKNTRSDEVFKNYSDIEKIYEKNGFVMAVRYPKNN